MDARGLGMGTLMLTFGLAAIAGCASPGGDAGGGDVASIDPAPPAVSAGAARKVAPAAVRVEQADRGLDVGREAAAAQRELQAVIDDPATAPDVRDQARLSLSRALEAQGDKEAAIAAVEKLLADHGDRLRSPLVERAEARLRKLLTGSEGDARSARAEDGGAPASAFARALAAYFPAPSDPDRPVEIRTIMFGGSREASEKLGTFAVERALRDLRRETCALCDDRISLRASNTRDGSWVGIPAQRARMGNALVVFYFDLGDGRIPARYDAELPLPSAEIAARLAHGDGLVAARERPGAPPVIVVAAPREAQLADVEEALSEMTSLPLTPVAVPLKAALKPQEIRVVVRSAFKSFRGCYEALLGANPSAAGRVALRFAVRGDGAPEGVSVDPSDSTLRDPTMDHCLTDAVGKLAFPATGRAEPTTVKYPLEFAPGGR